MPTRLRTCIDSRFRRRALGAIGSAAGLTALLAGCSLFGDFSEPPRNGSTADGGALPAPAPAIGGGQLTADAASALFERPLADAATRSATGDASAVDPSALARIEIRGTAGGAAPVSCPAIHWNFPIAGFRTDGGNRAVLVNTGTLPIAYTARQAWIVGAKYLPGVPTDGNYKEATGILKSGESADISASFAGGIFAIVGAVRPFRAGADKEPHLGEGAIVWPRGELAGTAASILYAVSLVAQDECTGSYVPF
jgi:hypothetical protein